MITKRRACTCLLSISAFLAGCAATNRSIVISVLPSPVFVGSAQTIQFTAIVKGDSSGVTWAVDGVTGGNSEVGLIDSNGNFTAPAVSQNTTATISAISQRDASRLGYSVVNIVAPGAVAPTNNPQVASYTITPPAVANISIQFGTDTAYGLTTWTEQAPANGPLSIYVAGMRANTNYHMRAVLQFFNGATVDDADHTFTTGSVPAAYLPIITGSTTSGMTPQPGVDMLDFYTDSKVPFAVTDLAGNVLWADSNLGRSDLNPVKLLPNGHFLENFAGSAPADGTNSVLREIDLGGNIIWQMTAADLNQALASAACAGCNISVVGTHHDFAVLPNGHIIVIAGQQKVESGLVGYSSPVTVDGDVLIDLDQNHKPVWVWSEFDHLDVNRHPMNFPDWTHTNAVVYSPDDGDLIVSIRHQYWVIKIDYDDGKGSGDILWKLGWQGDLALKNGTDPVDWQYAQHDANVISPNSSGVFRMTLFDNGDYRVLDSSGDTCGTSTTPACYSRVPIFQVDEAAKTATLEWIDNLSPIYSLWGGSSRLLGNGDLEFAECSLGPLGSNSAVYEVTNTSSPETVWQMQLTGANMYRAVRLPSLYPGVQW